MARSGLTGLPSNRPVETALTYLPGVSRSQAKSLLDRARIDPDLTTDELSDTQLDLLRQLLRAELRDCAFTPAERKVLELELAELIRQRDEALASPPRMQMSRRRLQAGVGRAL